MRNESLGGTTLPRSALRNPGMLSGQGQHVPGCRGVGRDSVVHQPKPVMAAGSPAVVGRFAAHLIARERAPGGSETRFRFLGR